jgi:hypothetical protein
MEMVVFYERSYLRWQARASLRHHVNLPSLLPWGAVRTRMFVYFRGLGRPSGCMGKCLYYLRYNQLGIYVEVTNKLNRESRVRDLLNTGIIIILAS